MKFATAAVFFAVVLVALLEFAMAEPQAVAGEDKSDLDANQPRPQPILPRLLQLENGQSRVKRASCASYGGQCYDIYRQRCSGRRHTGLCGGGTNIQCCIWSRG